MVAEELVKELFFVAGLSPRGQFRFTIHGLRVLRDGICPAHVHRRHRPKHDTYLDAQGPKQTGFFACILFMERFITKVNIYGTQTYCAKQLLPSPLWKTRSTSSSVPCCLPDLGSTRVQTPSSRIAASARWMGSTNPSGPMCSSPSS